MDKQPLSKETFKTVALISLIISLLFLVVSPLYFLLKLMSNLMVKPTMLMLSILNIAGSIILNIIGNNLLSFEAFLFIATAAIFGVGYFIKEDHDREFYQLLIYLSWFIIPLVTFLLILVSAPTSIVVGFLFLMYISPIPLFIIYKGLLTIINLMVDKFE